MKSYFFSPSLLKKIIIFFSFINIFSVETYSQPGPSKLCMLVYDKQGELLTLKKDLDLFSYLPSGTLKANGVYMAYSKEACYGDTELICVPIIIEVPKNIVSIIHKYDTMNIIIKNYSTYGYKLFIDSLIFSKGWFELKNENSVSYNEGQYKLENKMNIVYDTCFFNLARISRKYIIPVTFEISNTFKNQIPLSDKNKEAESTLVKVLAEKAEFTDSLGLKYIKCNFFYDGKEYSNTSVISKDFKSGPLYRIVVSFKKGEPQKILNIRFYPYGY